MPCCENLEVLDQAVANEALLGRLAAVSAVTFGVIPIEERADRMLVACGETWHPGCKPFVERLLGMPVDTLPFRDGVIKHYLLNAYLNDVTVNHNTFPGSDFIDNLGNLALLTSDKCDDTGEVRQDLPDDKLMLLDVTYVSVLNNLDGGGRQGEQLCGPLDVPFRVGDNGAAISADEVDKDVFLVMRKDFFYDALEHSGEDSFHGIQTLHLSELPHMIHPSEIQITQVARDGSLTFYLYDHLEAIAPGETREWTMSYYFMSLGNRHSRQLTLRVNGLTVVDRALIEVADGPIDWTADDLARWLRLGEEGRM